MVRFALEIHLDQLTNPNGLVIVCCLGKSGEQGLAQDTRKFWRNVALIIRRAPWLAITARAMWRLRQAKFSAGVVGVVFNDADEVLLVEHVFHPYTPWGLPGGWVDNREDPARTIERELLEELQLSVEIGPVLLVKVDYGNHIDLAYLCRPLSSIGNLSNELLDYRWVSLDELPRLHSFHHRAIVRAQELMRIA
jgi:8-oxo-dGTP diphosphatase